MTDIEAQINSMYALHNRIESALLATYGPIETWDTYFGVGLSSWQYKSLAATMAEWFIDWIKDEGMVRTPGTVEISREAATHIGHFMRDASHFDPEFDQWVLVEIDAALAKEDPA